MSQGHQKGKLSLIQRASDDISEFSMLSEAPANQTMIRDKTLQHQNLVMNNSRVSGNQSIGRESSQGRLRQYDAESLSSNYEHRSGAPSERLPPFHPNASGNLSIRM